jgi:hypothetical protein
MDADTLKNLLDESTDSIVASVKAKVVERCASNYEWKLAELVNAEVEKFFHAEVAPKIAAALAGEKGAIIEAAKLAAHQIAEKLAANMVERAVKNLDGYSYRDALKSLFA